MTRFFFVLLGFAGIVGMQAQRPFYAGARPGGLTTPSPLQNRFGEDGQPITTERLPYDAYGDWLFVEQIKNWPVDKQPFWYINRQAIEAHRQQPVIPSQPANHRPTFAGTKPIDSADPGQANIPQQPQQARPQDPQNTQTLQQRFGDQQNREETGLRWNGITNKWERNY